MDVIHDSFTEEFGFDFYGSPVTGVNSIETDFIIVKLDGGVIQNDYSGATVIQNGYYIN